MAQWASSQPSASPDPSKRGEAVGSGRRRFIPLLRQMPDMGDTRPDCLISAALASWDKPHLSNYKAFLDDDMTAERRYTGII